MKLLPAFLLSHSWGAVQLEFPQFPQFALPPFRLVAWTAAGCRHCQQKSDFPAFPVFPTESVVLGGTLCPYG